MMSTKTEVKNLLLLCPQKLTENDGIIQSLHILKAAAGINFKTFEADMRELNKFFPSLPKTVTDILVRFDQSYCAQRKHDIRQKYSDRKSGLPYNSFYRTSLLRELHQLFMWLKPFTPLVKWYHRIWTDKVNVKTGPCSFSTYKPQLQFEVSEENNELVLKTNIMLNGAVYKLEEFQQYSFLLLSNNEYFLLSFKDFQTLEWIAENNPAQYSTRPEEMARHILSRLEEDYKVERNGFFTQNTIEVLPVKRVLLSEISNSFLVLTPQWVYDGFVVEWPWKEFYETTQEGEAYWIKRNKEEEKDFLKLLEGLHPNFVKQLNGYYYVSFADAQKKQWFLKTYHYLLEQNIQVVGMDMLQHFRYSKHKAVTKLNITENNDNTLTLKLSLSFDDEEVPLQELQKMLLAGQKAILLKDGSLGVLGDDWMRQYGTILKHGKVSKKEVTVARWMAITEDVQHEEPAILKPVIKKDWWQRWDKWQQPDSVIYNVPAEVKASLRPYQHKGFEWLVLLAEAGAGACLADDMGLGKTLQAICFIAYRAHFFPGQKHIVVCPASLLYNWMQEFEKFAPHLNAIVYHGAQRKLEDINKPGNDIIITSYGTIRSDFETLGGIPFGVAVIDESHNIKNPAALITRAIGHVNADIRIALSGTPVMNNTFDLYAQLSFVLPGMFGSREFFKREYADAIDREHDAEKIKALQKITAPFILRRTKEQVARDLPEKVETILWCNMGANQKSAYECIRENVRSNIFLEIKEKGLNQGKLSVINGLLKLRQACNSCQMIKDEELLSNDSIKTDILIAELKNIIPDHKALVFSQFTSMLDLLEESLQKNAIKFTRLDGNTPIDKRQELVNSFQQDSSPEKVFLISLKAGNTGLNLTAADYVFLFDPWWNTAVQQQAIDRTHRIGQTKPVFAYQMICKDTVEEKIIQLQLLKKKLAEDLIGEEEGFVKSLTETDIEFLFS